MDGCSKVLRAIQHVHRVHRPITMCLAAYPGQIAETHKYWDLAVADYTSNDLRKGAFGKTLGTIHPVRTARSWQGFQRTGSPARPGEPIFQAGGQALSLDAFNPHCIHVPWCVLSIPHTKSPTESAMPSHVFYSPTTVPQSALYACVARDKNRIYTRGRRHIFRKGSSRQTCRKSTSEFWFERYPVTF